MTTEGMKMISKSRITVRYAETDKMGIVHHRPVVQPRPLHGPVGDIKPQGPDQMEPRSGGGAGTGNIAGVHGDLRLHKDDIDHPAPSPHFITVRTYFLILFLLCRTFK